MKNKNNYYINITQSAIKKTKKILLNKNLNLRIYITGGGCNGFKYNFKIDEKVHKHDTVIKNSGISFVIDPISIQYIHGGTIDYLEDFSGSMFSIKNPNAKQTCSCGESFSA
ncbi:iron-sulfur cluster insertion protein ErpA [Buchnera aphidicola]|uniref:Iron-sulfur cluster insertion protein ErpA n=1 Tax=Buchnera aphidicola (Anoecia oenotherae) TaxID=1241833 RepID=A0A4D6XZ67_9GAMM|nr:iron-sulfur cluster insertion protein ErpA [Buchnera aphidicola]QCI19300.1 iron-sulfur cluster insertion protein ErpA [Buchnera aphidicola (Anoecia oenotherae)]